ncbi:hypothetical protein R7P37_14430 [Vibrio sp. 431]|uniref:hypothetical protein n=1 Tax=Vibrio TaxID=662 RepID=UPI002964A10D|nr:MULTISPECIES: hypothetical protein [unclassified Vibrio]MDW1964772.1 hypothetical protein [Vibrio sp. Vb0587]MDW2006637.1 hypothetical protein [Vibrio sp. 431]
MKVLFNSNGNFKLGSVRIPFYAYKRQFEKMSDVEVFENDYDNYSNYDVLIAPADSDFILKAKKENPSLVICLTKPHHERLVSLPFSKISLRDIYYQLRLFYPESWSPKLKKLKSNIYCSDLVIADSPYLNLFFKSKNIDSVYLRLLEEIPDVETKFSSGDDLVFGYHGNYKHFNESMTYILPELEKLSNEYNVTLKVMTNLSVAKLLYSEKIKIEYQEYSYPDIYNFLSDIDIGLVPNNIPVRNSLVDSLFHAFGCLFWKTDRKHDLILRYKQSVNAGRAYVFSQINKPFIACGVPDVCSDFGKVCGEYMPLDIETWKFSIRELSRNKDDRVRISRHLEYINDNEINLLIESEKLKKCLINKVERG